MSIQVPRTGKELKAWRTSRGYSRREIGELSGKNPRTVETWEQGEEKEIPVYAQKLIEHVQQENKAFIDLSDTARSELEKRAITNGTSVGEELSRLVNGIFGLFLLIAMVVSIFLPDEDGMMARRRGRSREEAFEAEVC